VPFNTFRSASSFGLLFVALISLVGCGSEPGSSSDINQSGGQTPNQVTNGSADPSAVKAASEPVAATGPIERVHPLDDLAMVALAMDHEVIEGFDTPKDAWTQLKSAYFLTHRFAASLPPGAFDRAENEFQERRLYQTWLDQFEKEKAAARNADVLVFRWSGPVGSYDFDRQVFPLPMDKGARQNQRFIELNRVSSKVGPNRRPLQLRGLQIELAGAVTEMPVPIDEAERLAELMQDRGRGELRVAGRPVAVKPDTAVFDLGLGRKLAMPTAVMVVQPVRVEVVDQRTGATVYGFNVNDDGAATLAVVEAAHQRWLRHVGDGAAFHFAKGSGAPFKLGSRVLAVAPGDDGLRGTLIDTYRFYRYAGGLDTVSAGPTLDGYHYAMRFERGDGRVIGSMDERMQRLSIDLFVPVYAADPMPTVFQGVQLLNEVLVPHQAQQARTQAALWNAFFQAIEDHSATVVSGDEALLPEAISSRVVAFAVGQGGRTFGGGGGQYTQNSSLDATARHAGLGKSGDIIVCRVVNAGNAQPQATEQNGVAAGGLRGPAPVATIEKLWPTLPRSALKFVGWDEP